MPTTGNPLEGTIEIDGLPGVYYKPGVVLTGQLMTFLALMRTRTSDEIPIVVTSGVRSIEAQAAALVKKREHGADLTQLYRSATGSKIAAELMSVPASRDAFTAILARWAADGVMLSRHQRGDALDLRVRGLTEWGRGELIRAAQSLGARAFLEGQPAHIHVEDILRGLNGLTYQIL